MNIVKITDVNSKDFDDSFKLRDAVFPEGMKSIERVKKLIADGSYMLYACKINGSVVAFRLIYDGGDFMLGDCMAVDESYRNHGIGTLMVRHIIGLAFGAGKRAFFFENYLSANDGDEDYIRTEFFKKLGAVLISDKYYLPEIPPLRMKLLAFVNGTINDKFVMESVGKIYSFYGKREQELLDRLRVDINDREYVGV